PWQAARPSRVRRGSPRPGPGLPVSRPAARVPVGRAVAGSLLAVAVTGVTLLAAACSRGPDMPAVPSGGVSAVRPSPGSAPGPGSASAPAGSAYAACMRAHGVAGFSYPTAGDVAAIAPAIGLGLNSVQFSAAEVACGR
ncbi:MAG: hypothetical protein ACRDP7_02860, partial [Trebonia sp.]